MRSQPTAIRYGLKSLERSPIARIAPFESLASELEQPDQGRGRRVEPGRNVGLTVDPSNPLDAGGKLDEAAAARAAIITAPTEPLEEADLDASRRPRSRIPILRDIESPEASSASTLFDEAPLMPAAGAAATSAQSPVVSDLDFDLGDFGKQIDVPSEMVAEPAEVAPVSAPVAEPAAAAPALDFGSIDFDLEVPATPANEPQGENSIEPPVAMDVAGAASEAPIEPIESDRQALAEPVSAATALDFDLEGIDLDLGDVDDDSVDSYSAEMSTKLDLALAYREIGDREGARELLDEVVKSGSQQQVDQAKSLLAELV